jgi:hypothetical protein
MNNIRRFRYVKPIYKKSIILNNKVKTNYLKSYIKSYSNLVSYNKSNNPNNLILYTKPKSDLVLYNKPELVLYNKSELVLYNKPDLGLVLYNVNNNILNYKSNKYLNTYILFKIAYFINFVL